MGQTRAVAALVTALLLVPVTLLSGASETAGAAGPVPAQWIVKQHTELLGRVPTASEWDTWASFYSGATSGCSATTLATLGRQLATGNEFAGSYPETSLVDRAARFTALIRATFERDPTVADWTTHVSAYLNGTRTWSQVVDGVFSDTAFGSVTAPKVCGNTSSGFGYTPPIDMRAATGGGTSRTAQQVQSAIDAAAAAGGGTVALQPGEVVRVGATSNQQLVVKAGVTLTTTGAPTPSSYARMGRLVAPGPNGVVCGGFLCFNTGIVAIEPGGTLRNVWVDGHGMSPVNAQMANIETRGSTSARPTAVLDNRVTNPGRVGAGIRARGFSVFGADCAGETIRGNLVTAYTARGGLDGMLQPLGVDGILVHCESAIVESNTVVDATNAGIMLYGSYNRQRDETRPQRSRIAGNAVVSAGLGAHVAIGVDPTGECAGSVDPRLVPCIDVPTTRSFDGATVRDNAFWTGPRTAFEIGLMVGSAPLWGDHRVPGSGGSYTGNSTGGIGARVNLGISTLGMNAATVSGNASSFSLVDVSPGQQWGKCPMAAEATAAADGCVIDGAPASGLERIKVSSDGNRLVGASSGRTFTPWGMRTPEVSMEEVWDTDWNRLVEAFREIRRMGANIVRLKLQFLNFVDAPPTPPPSSTTTTTTQPPPSSTTTSTTTTTTQPPPPSTDPPPPSTDPPPPSTDPPPPPTEPTATSAPTATSEGEGASGALMTAALATETDQYGTPNTHSLEKLREVIALAEQSGLYVELTGLKIEEDADTGTWYDQLDEQGRWAAQAVFWSAVAGAVKNSPAVAWLDLMSEPVAPGANQAQWCVGGVGGFCHTQFLTKTPNGRTKVQIAQQWATLMRDAIRIEGGDTNHLISVGLLPRGNSGFRGVDLAGIEDFSLVHMYPRPDDPATPVDELQADIDEIRNSKPPGQPLVVDETFTFFAVETDVMEFVLAIRPESTGTIGHYFEKTPAQLTPPPTVADALHQLFYKMFLSLTPTMLDPIAQAGGLPSAPPPPPPPPPPPTTTPTSAPTTTTAPPTETFLSDLNPTFASNGLGPIERNRANGGSAAGDGPALKLKGVTYTKGIGVNAGSEIHYTIPTGATSFRASLGLDDSACASTVRLEIALNGGVIGVSGLPASFTKTTATFSLNVNVTGKSTLRLSVINTGAASNCDHWDWANARFVRPTTTTSTTSPPPTTSSTTTTTTTKPPTSSTSTTSTTTTTTPPTSSTSTSTTPPTSSTSTSTTTTTTKPPTSTAPTSTTAPGTTTYLSDLTPTVAKNGLGPVERNRANGGSAAGDGPPLKLKGITYLKGLGVNAYSSVEYAVNGATSFKADLGLDDSACASTVRLEIALNDGVIEVAGMPAQFTKATPTIAITVNVTGKTKLRLSVINTGTASNCDHFDWANARFIR